jgi:crotonobetainyl-CoA:carnitine CoA-transferase CaiB-like acyl-CoA transferase
VINRPLEGFRVVELGTLIAAPFATRMLADFGAEVIKVESLNGGDPLRNWRMMHGDTSLWWYLQSRNKKSLGVDLKSPEGQAVVRRLLLDADVLVENFRPGTLERWGLGWDELHAANPALTMVRISGYGQTGPYSERPGFGSVAEAIGGIRHTTGEKNGVPARTGISLGDSLASLHAIIGALLSIVNVKCQGRPGQIVDVALYECVFNLMESSVPEYDLFNHVRERSSGALPGICPSNTYRAKDGRFIVIAGNGDSIYRRLMNAIGRADLAAHPAYQNNAGRVAACEEIDGAIEAWTSGLELNDALARLEAADVPASSIYSVKDIMEDPHYQARDMLLDGVLPDGTKVKFPGIVPKLNDTPGSVEWLGPTIGEHTGEVLAGIGYDAVEIEALKARGVIQ